MSTLGGRKAEDAELNLNVSSKFGARSEKSISESIGG